jgi:ribosomal protein S18 acetylase RimI-like enzyme
VTDIHIRPARLDDADAVAALIILTPGGLLELLGDRKGALRVARAAFTAEGTGFAYHRALLAVVDGSVAGQIIRFSGEQWVHMRTRTGLVMVRAAGLRFGLRLIRQGRLEERVMPHIPQDSLYVISLAVAPQSRNKGIGSVLLRRVVEEAVEAGLRSVALDVAADNDGGIRFYEREGFVTIAERRAPSRRGLPAFASKRMELAL